MKRSLETLSLALCSLAVVTTLGACAEKEDPKQREACEAFARHLAAAVQTDQGETVSQEQVDEMVASTTDKCVETPPKADELECAMAAKDLAGIKACDPEAEAEAKPE